MLRVLYDPDGFFEEYKDGFAIPITIVTLSGVVGAVFGYMKAPEILNQLISNYPQLSHKREFLETFITIQSVVSPLIGVFLGWVIMAGILHILSALFNGEGGFDRTLKFISFSFIPQIVLSPLSYHYISLKPTQEMITIGLANSLWQGYILVFALKHARRIETSKAVICVAIPIAFSYALSFIVGWFR